MTDKELLEKSASRFRLIAEDTLKITTGNLSHNLTSLRGFALRAAEIIDKHLKALQEEPVSNPTPNKKMSVERWKKACEAACCDINYRSHYGLTETRDDYFVDGVQWADENPKEEPVNRTPADIEAAMQEVEEKSRVFTEAHKGEDTDTILAQMRGEEPVSEDLEKIVEEIAEPTILNAYGTKELARRLSNTICGISISEDLGEYINELSKQFPEVSFAKLSRIAVRVAKWQKEQMMTKAIDGYVIKDVEEGNGDFLLSADYLPKSMGLKDQQRVKVIVIKEN